MADRPILFSGPLVKAILEGRKSVTRRLATNMAMLRVNAEDRLWVRETWCNMPNGYGYRATGALRGRNPWKPSIHMPRWASRLSLEVTGMRVERVQDISDPDVLAEGKEQGNNLYDRTGLTRGLGERVFRPSWDAIYGKSYSWKSNPWVWVVEFEVLR